MYHQPRNPGTLARRRLASQKVCIMRCSNVSIVGLALGTKGLKLSEDFCNSDLHFEGR